MVEKITVSKPVAYLVPAIVVILFIVVLVQASNQDTMKSNQKAITDDVAALQKQINTGRAERNTYQTEQRLLACNGVKLAGGNEPLCNRAPSWDPNAVGPWSPTTR
jgi:hypothetical protein